MTLSSFYSPGLQPCHIPQQPSFVLKHTQWLFLVFLSFHISQTLSLWPQSRAQNWPKGNSHILQTPCNNFSLSLHQCLCRTAGINKRSFFFFSCTEFFLKKWTVFKQILLRAQSLLNISYYVFLLSCFVTFF